MFQKTSGLTKGIGSSQHCLDFCSQHCKIKWLGNKIICTAAHSHYHIHIIRSRRKKQYWYL